MSMTDPIADMLTRVRNASTARHEEVEIPASRMKMEIARLMQEQGYIASYVVKPALHGNVIVLTLKYGRNRERVISGIKRVSRPGRRIYALLVFDVNKRWHIAEIGLSGLETAQHEIESISVLFKIHLVDEQRASDFFRDNFRESFQKTFRGLTGEHLVRREQKVKSRGEFVRFCARRGDTENRGA